jgi:hypothetical protein
MSDDKVIESAVSVWDSDDVKSFEGEGGGNGWISKAEIVFGYKVFIAGRTNEETFWKFDVAVPASREAARKAAADFARSVGAKQPTAAIAVILPKDKTYLYDTTRWQGDRWFVLPTYTKAYEDILKPSLKGADAQLGVQWVRIGFKPDPYKPTRKLLDQLTGEEREIANLVPYVVEKFDSEEMAMRVIEAEMVGNDTTPAPIPGMTPSSSSHEVKSESTPAGTSGTKEFPDGWDNDSWNFAVKDIREQAKVKSPAEIAKAYDIPVSFVVKALG